MGLLTSTSNHPYFPRDADLAHYAPSQDSLSSLLTTFVLGMSVVLLAAYGSCSLSAARLRAIDKFCVVWFSMCGCIHIVLEGYFIFHYESIAAEQTFFAQIWKEYALSDSRYLASDVFTVCIETVTALLWGPLCLWTAYSIIQNSPARHIYQTVICTAHWYGVILYYYTSWFDYASRGISYSRPEFLYLGVYFIGFNAPWAVIPPVLVYDSMRQVTRAFIALDEANAVRKTH